MSRLPHGPELLKALREAMSLTQSEMAALLGVAPATLNRLERNADLKAWGSGSTARVVLLLGEIGVSRLPDTIRRLLVNRPTTESTPKADPDLVVAKVTDSVRRMLDVLPPADQLSATTWTLGELVAETWASRESTRSWCYWATSAKADIEPTLALAEDHGLICRVIYGANGHVRPFLSKLRPGDSLLLCYDGEPKRWYTIEGGDSPPRDLVFRKKDARRDELGRLLASAPVFRWVHQGTELGQQLKGAGYALFDESNPVNAKKRSYFSCLAVKLDKERAMRRPLPRRPGVQDTITPFIDAELGPLVPRGSRVRRAR